MSSDSTSPEPEPVNEFPAELAESGPPDGTDSATQQPFLAELANVDYVDAASAAIAPVPAEPVTVETIDEHALSRLHPTSLLFDVISHSRAYLVPAIIAMFSAASGEVFGVVLAGFIFIPAILVSIFRYFTFRYSIQNKQLVITKGLIFRSVRTVPVSRIQNVDFVQNILHRLLNVAEVRVETASGTEPEAVMRVLSIHQMEQLRREIFDLQAETGVTGVNATEAGLQFEGAAAPTGGAMAQTDHESGLRPVGHAFQAGGRNLLEIPLGWLTKAGLASNRGMIIVGIIVGGLFQFDESRRLDRFFNHLEEYLPKDVERTSLIVGIVGAALLILVLLRLFGIAWYIWRFYDYKLIRYGEDLRISCGLLTKVSATVPRNRIQFISIHRTLIMRWMGLASIRIETAGGAGKQNEDATATVSRRWFVPVIPEEQVPGLLEELRPGLSWNEANLVFQPLAPRARTRMVRVAVVLSVIVAGIGLAFIRPWGVLFGLAVLPWFVWWAIQRSKSMKYARTADGVVYRSGILNRKTSMTFFEKVQVLEYHQSPFDRRWKMARLVVDTAASGPAEHRVAVGYLDAGFVDRELEELRMRTARHEPSFV